MLSYPDKIMGNIKPQSCKDHLPGDTLKLRAELKVYGKEMSTLIKEDPEHNNGSTLAPAFLKESAVN